MLNAPCVGATSLLILAAVFLASAFPAETRAGEPVGFEFGGCGELVQTSGFPSCLVLVIHTGERMVLTNYGPYQAGDRVYVAGDFDPDTAMNCDFTITPILINPIIEGCFARCGTILPDEGSCHLIMTSGGETFALSQSTGMAVGTPVFVTGRIAAEPATCPSGLYQLIEEGEFGPCGGGFGRLLLRDGCTVFVDRSGAEFDLQNTGGFSPGDFVEVAGLLDDELLGSCGRPLIRENTIHAAFGGAGTVVNDPMCGLYFRADVGGFGSIFRVDGIENFSPGDRVFVTGAIEPVCNNIPECSVGCLRESSIRPLFARCGGIYPTGNGCALFDTLDGEISRVIENDGGQFPGAYVFVAGAMAADSVLCADSPHPVVTDNTVQPCYQSCGELMQGFECTPLFFGDDGGFYWLENVGNFQAGDRVYVSGGRGGQCNLWCPFPCIQVNTISYCPGSGDVNFDGFVDPDDIPFFVAVALGEDTNVERIRAADVNGSGDVNGADIQLFTLYVMGI